MKYSNLDAVPTEELHWLQEVDELRGRMALCARCHLHLIDEDRGDGWSSVRRVSADVIAIGEQCVSCGLIRSGILEHVLCRVEQAVAEARVLGATDDDIARAGQTSYLLSHNRWRRPRLPGDYPDDLRVIVAEARSLAAHDRWADERDAHPAEEHR
jgi:hypothetical protein